MPSQANNSKSPQAPTTNSVGSSQRNEIKKKEDSTYAEPSKNTSDFSSLHDNFMRTEEQTKHTPTAPPCIGCGWCCLDHPCDQSVHKYGYTRVCPELLWNKDDNRYYCKLYFNSQTKSYIQEAQRIGQGCCAPDNSWRQDVCRRD